MNREAVAEQQRLALGQIRADVLFKARWDFRIRHCDKNHVGLLYCLTGFKNLEAALLCNRCGFGAGVEADDDLHAALFEIERVGVAL